MAGGTPTPRVAEMAGETPTPRVAEWQARRLPHGLAAEEAGDGAAFELAGAAEVVALHELEADLAAGLGFAGRFDPFGQRDDAELAAHADERLDQLPAAGIRVVDAGDHLAVEFYKVGAG